MKPTARSLLLLALLLPFPVRASAQDVTTPPFRVLIVAKADDSGRDQYSERAAFGLGSALRSAEFQVIDADQARRQAERSMGSLGAWTGEIGESPVSSMAAMAFADVMVEVVVSPKRQQKAQGRYLVTDRAQWRTVFVDGAERIGGGEVDGAGQSFDGFDEAHDAALDGMMDVADDKSLAARIIAELRAIRDSERADGAWTTVGFFVENQPRYLKLSGALEKTLRGAEGVVATTVQSMRQYPCQPFANGPKMTAQLYRFRFRGDQSALQAALMTSLESQSAAIEAESGLLPSPVFASSGRRMDLVVRFTESPESLSAEVDRVVREAVDVVWSRNQGSLSSKRLNVLPASIAITDGIASELLGFRRAFWKALESAEKRLSDANTPDADPLDVEQAVEYGGRRFENLRAAQNHLFELEARFAQSPEGELAGGIARTVQEAFTDSSAGAVSVQPTDRNRDRALDLIRIEAAAYAADQAVDPRTIALYQQEGSEVFVATRLRKHFDCYMVTVDAVDLSSGATYQGTAQFHQRFTEALLSELGG